jgi:hypothetical protein
MVSPLVLSDLFAVFSPVVIPDIDDSDQRFDCAIRRLRLGKTQSSAANAVPLRRAPRRDYFRFFHVIFQRKRGGKRGFREKARMIFL